tara:strand:- start:184 stop:681 length:498 start_codon:yes stop_codon:yes gene_type:complete
MKLNGLIYSLPREVKNLIVPFIIVLSIGYFVSILLVDHTSSLTPSGIEKNYLGNELSEISDNFKFKKSTYQIYNLIHSHIISMSIIFFVIGLLLIITDLNYHFKWFLMIEPFFSIILTFGGIYMLWNGITWMKYIIFISSLLMAIVFFISCFVILSQSLSKKTKV